MCKEKQNREKGKKIKTHFLCECVKTYKEITINRLCRRNEKEI